MDMAVGIIIGAAFSDIVASLTDQKSMLVNSIGAYYNRGKEKVGVSLWRKPLRNCKLKMISCLVSS